MTKRSLTLLAAFALLLPLSAAAQTATPRVCKATAAAPTNAEGGFVPLSCELDGDLRINSSAAGSTAIEGPDAHDAPLTGKPVTAGGYASATAPAAVGAADAVRSWHTLNGAQATAGSFQVNTAAGLSTDQLMATAGVSGSTPPFTYATGRWAAPWLSLSGGTVVQAYTSSSVAPANGQSSLHQPLNAVGNHFYQRTIPYVYNGASWDMTAGNTTGRYVGAPTTGGDPCGATGVVKSSVAINAAADAELVAISGTTQIYVCGFNFTLNGTTPSARFQTGTGAVCATGTVQKTGVMLPTVGLNVLSAGGGYTIFKGAAGEALCIDVAGASVSAQGVLTYVQQ